MELTINNLIKMVIASVVIVVVILGVYFSMKAYVIPYFSGISFEEPKIDINTQFSKELIQEKNLIGRVDENSFFISEKEGRTKIYFKKDKIYLEKYGLFGLDELKFDEEIGELDNEGKISIYYGVEGSEGLNSAYKYGKEIYKIK